MSLPLRPPYAPMEARVVETSPPGPGCHERVWLLAGAALAAEGRA